MGYNLKRFGRKNAILFGYSIVVFATIGFGAIVYISNEYLFLNNSYIVQHF